MDLLILSQCFSKYFKLDKTDLCFVMSTTLYLFLTTQIAILLNKTLGTFCVLFFFLLDLPLFNL